MTSDPIPSVFFGAGYSYASNAITLNTEAHASALLDELDATEANATTGDYRCIMFALLEMLYQKMLAATPASEKVSMTRATYEDLATSELVRTYTVQIRTVASGIEVADE